MQSGVRAIQSVDKQRQLPVEINRLRRWFARGAPEDSQLVSFQKPNFRTRLVRRVRFWASRDSTPPRPHAVILDPDAYELWLDPGLRNVGCGVRTVEAFRCPADAPLSCEHSDQSSG
jgi:hypothetical protein